MKRGSPFAWYPSTWTGFVLFRKKSSQSKMQTA